LLRRETQLRHCSEHCKELKSATFAWLYVKADALQNVAPNDGYRNNVLLALSVV